MSQDQNNSGANLLDLRALPAIYERIKSVLGVKTQREVATSVGLSQQVLSNLLSSAEGKEFSKGPKNLPFKQLLHWAVSNRVSIDWLFTGKGSPSDVSADAEEEEPGQATTNDDVAQSPGTSIHAREEAELLGAETAAWLLRQAVTNTQRWPELVAGLWEFRNQWETGGKPPMEREPPDQADAGLAGEKASGGKG